MDQPWSAGNPPFAGPGPHLIAPVAVDSNLPDDIAVGSVIGHQPPGGTDESVLTNPMTSKLAEVQLLACVQPKKGAGPIGEVRCHFGDTDGSALSDLTFPLYEGDYEVTVREARTGRVVSTLSVPGTLNGSENCPGVATDTGHTVLLRGMDRNLLSDTLRPLSAAPAPR